MARIRPIREEKREGEVEREDSRGDGWEGLVVLVAVAWSLGLINRGGLEREREFETREAKSLRGEKRDTLRQERKS